jgi:hypothetical protein
MRRLGFRAPSRLCVNGHLAVTVLCTVGGLVVDWSVRTRCRHAIGAPCPQRCGSHRDSCALDCGRHARRCPQRQGGGLILREPKGRNKREITLPVVLIETLRGVSLPDPLPRSHGRSPWSRSDPDAVLRMRARDSELPQLWLTLGVECCQAASAAASVCFGASSATGTTAQRPICRHQHLALARFPSHRSDEALVVHRLGPRPRPHLRVAVQVMRRLRRPGSRR